MEECVWSKHDEIPAFLHSSGPSHELCLYLHKLYLHVYVCMDEYTLRTLSIPVQVDKEVKTLLITA